MRIAVIDIGSNAIRAAIYDSNDLGSAEIFNEKFKSDLTSLLEHEFLDIRHSTYNIFNYFTHIFRQLKVSQIECVATEVLRNHKRADEFAKVLNEKYGINVRILSGDEEARITAEGLISSIPDAQGIAADLGGGSLEVAEVFDKRVHRVKSLPLGTKVLSKLQIENPAHIIELLEKEFKTECYSNLYLIGGALRLLGRCYMDYNHNTIKNLHNLVIDPTEFMDFLDQLENLQKFLQFFKQYKINRSAITVMRGLINYFKPKKLVVSTFGLKEGIRFNLLAKEEREKDIVLERCKEFAKIHVATLHVEAYNQIFASLELEESENLKNLFIIALILSQYTKHVDRNYRAEWIISFVLTTDIPFNQLQRASLIISIAHALSNKNNIIPNNIKKLLSKRESSYAHIIGALIKIAILIDGPMLSQPSFKIVYKGRFLEIVTDNIMPRTTFDKVCEQLKSIGLSKRCL